jgi:predicted DCC family thiol-disulfide oxidoreductase YuxK
MDTRVENSPVLLYDGVCGFCNKSVQFILDHDRRGTLLFAPLQSNFGKSVIERFPELQNIDSVVFVERPATGQERVYIRSSAALRVAGYLGGIWKLFLITYIIPAPLRDFLYDLFARYRYRIFGKYDSCMLPPKEVRARFVDF